APPTPAIPTLSLHDALPIYPFVTVRVNPDVQHGWGIRPDDWQFGIAVQQQIAPRVALDISYNRRWWGNFYFTDNLALGPQDFDRSEEHTSELQSHLTLVCRL